MSQKLRIYRNWTGAKISRSVHLWQFIIIQRWWKTFWTKILTFLLIMLMFAFIMFCLIHLDLSQGKVEGNSLQFTVDLQQHTPEVTGHWLSQWHLLRLSKNCHVSKWGRQEKGTQECGKSKNDTELSKLTVETSQRF